jgi:hypothetical protein
MRFGAACAIALLALAPGCADYKQTRSATRTIYDVRVTTKAGDVANCRFLEKVDSRDSARGCGLTVQPTPEECLRYQVRRAGGDTLLRDGPVGGAYACSAHDASPKAEAAPPPAPPPATPAPAPAVSAAPPPPPAPVERPASDVRLTSDRDAAKGCVYLGDVAEQTACERQGGQASGDCADEARKAGGDLILVEGARAQIFSCKARP